MQNRELTATENYSDYVHEYEWVAKDKFYMGQWVEYSGDHSAAEWISDKGQECILFYAESISNGIPTTVGGILKAKEGRLSLVWPYMADEWDGFACEGYWHPCNCGKKDENSTEEEDTLPIHRTARLKNGKLNIYRVNFIFHPDTPMIMGYDLVFEKEIGSEYISEAEKILEKDAKK